MIALGRFDQFRSDVAKDTPGVTPLVRRDLALHALQAALQNGTDKDFVTSELGLSKILTLNDIDTSIRFSIAERLAKIGLATRALRYLPEQPETLTELSVATQVMTLAGQYSDAVAKIRDSKFEGSETLLANTLAKAGLDK